MNATSAAKHLSSKNSDLKWPGLLPQCIYDLDVPQLPSGPPILVGKDFHANLERHLAGKWVSKDHYYTCSAVAEILRDLGLERKSLKTEVPLQRGSLTGQADLVGVDAKGKTWVVEIKTTQGCFALAPSSTELCQLALYAHLLDLKEPTLACIRVNLRLGKAGVYHTKNERLVSKVRESARRMGFAA